MNTVQNLERDSERILRHILAGLMEFQITSEVSPEDRGFDLAVDAVFKKIKFRFRVQAKSRVTPQTAISICQQLRGLPAGTIPVIYSPTISPRVAEILREEGIGYLDRAGNCWLRSLNDHLLIERQGIPTERIPTLSIVNPFSTKSSRIVRSLLSQPLKGWQVRELAEHADVQVSPGLVVKVKRALVDEGYAIERDKLLYLRDPIGLLSGWSHKYSGPAEQLSLYFRGDAASAEQSISRWCHKNELQFAFAGYSAAWRLAPDVRYPVGAIYVEDRGFDHRLMEQLTVEFGGKRVDSGPNLYLWRPFDRSVFAGSKDTESGKQPVTSPLQTYLDLKRTAGRGEDAANAIFEKYLSRDLKAVVQREAELKHGAV